MSSYGDVSLGVIDVWHKSVLFLQGSGKKSNVGNTGIYLRISLNLDKIYDRRPRKIYLYKLLEVCKTEMKIQCGAVGTSRTGDIRGKRCRQIQTDSSFRDSWLRAWASFSLRSDRTCLLKHTLCLCLLSLFFQKIPLKLDWFYLLE